MSTHLKVKGVFLNMDMTLEQYMINPMGKNNAVLNASAREIIRKTYSHKFDNILLRENGKIEYYLYIDNISNTYWAHIKVPSEVVKDFYYDVVFKFSASQNVESSGEDLFKYNVKFYSNDPAFVYTYAHVFIKNNIFINELVSKMSKQAIRKPPTEKNPNKDVGYVKAIYFAYLTMQNKKLNKMVKFKGEAKPLDLRYLLNSIEKADDKIKKRQEEGAKVSKRKKIVLDKKTASNVLKYASKDANLERLNVKTTKKIGSIQNKVGNVKQSKTTKRK